MLLKDLFEKLKGYPDDYEMDIVTYRDGDWELKLYDNKYNFVKVLDSSS